MLLAYRNVSIYMAFHGGDPVRPNIVDGTILDQVSNFEYRDYNVS